MFALGCVIAYAAGGAGPFGTGTAAAVLYRVVHGEAVLDRVPPALREIVSRCLAKDPAARPAPAALAAELAGRDRGTGPSAVAFWPRQVAGVLGAYQARLEQEAGEPGRPAEVFSPAGATHPATAAAGRLARRGTRAGRLARRGTRACEISRSPRAIPVHGHTLRLTAIPRPRGTAGRVHPATPSLRR